MKFAFHLLAICLVFTYSTACCQETEIDSLQQVVKTTSGTKKVDALNALGFRLILVDVSQADAPIDLAIRISVENQYNRGLAEAQIYKGLCENLKGNRALSLGLLRKGIALAHRDGFTGLEGYGLVQQGNLYRGFANYDSAQYWYDQSFLVLKDSLNPWHLSIFFRNQAALLRLKGEAKKEKGYLNRAFAIREKLPDKILLTDILTQLSGWYLDQDDLEQAKRYLSRAERTGLRDTLPDIHYSITYQKAQIAFREARYMDALTMLREGREYYLRVGNIKQSLNLMLDLAFVLEEFGNYELSLDYALDGLAISEEKKFADSETAALITIARDYYRINQLITAHDFADRALLLAEKNNFRIQIANAHLLKGMILSSQLNFTEALKHLEQALARFQEIEDSRGIGTTLSIIGEAHEALGNLAEAASFYQRSLAIRESILHQNGMAWAYHNLGSVYTKMHNFARAGYYLDLAEKKSHATKAGTVLIKVLLAKRDLLQKEGRTQQALQYSIMYEALKDSVNSASVNNRILSLQSSYEMEKKEREIDQLNQLKQTQLDQITIQTGQIRQQRIVIAFVVVGLVFVAALAYVSYQYFKKTRKLNYQLQERNEEVMTQAEELAESNLSLTDLNKTLSEKQDEIEAQSEELRESHSVIMLLNQSLEDKVNERTIQLQQAYKELDTFFYRSSHDFRRPLTTFMGLSAVAKITLKEKEAIDLFGKVEETAVNLDRMLIKLQSISDVGADQMALKLVSVKSACENALHAYQNEINEFGIQTGLTVSNDTPVKSYPGHLKNIIENLVENSIRFRTYDNPIIHIEAVVSQKELILQVSDNGEGIGELHIAKVFDMFFRASDRSKGNGLGLYIVKKAVEKMNGRVQVANNPGGGCTFTVQIPLIT